MTTGLYTRRRPPPVIIKLPALISTTQLAIDRRSQRGCSSTSTVVERCPVLSEDSASMTDMGMISAARRALTASLLNLIVPSRGAERSLLCAAVIPAETPAIRGVKYRQDLCKQRYEGNSWSWLTRHWGCRRAGMPSRRPHAEERTAPAEMDKVRGSLAHRLSEPNQSMVWSWRSTVGTGLGLIRTRTLSPCCSSCRCLPSKHTHAEHLQRPAQAFPRLGASF